MKANFYKLHILDKFEAEGTVRNLLSLLSGRHCTSTNLVTSEVALELPESIGKFVSENWCHISKFASEIGCLTDSITM